MLQHDRQDKKASVIVSMEMMQQGVRQLPSWKTELCVSFPNFLPQKQNKTKLVPFFTLGRINRMNLLARVWENNNSAIKRLQM